MRIPHLCWVHEPPASFAPLVEAARGRGLRVGWLQLGACAPPPGLAPAAEAGAARAVAVGGGASVALKPIAGTPVLRDLLREHFLGFSLVLLSGDPSAPGVRIDDGLAPWRLWRCRGESAAAEDPAARRWKLVSPDGRERTLDDERLLGRLGRPRLASARSRGTS